MRVSELIRLLQKFPGDYAVGEYRASLAPGGGFSFRLLDPEVGVNNTKRRVALTFGPVCRATKEEFAENIEVTL